MNLLNDKLTVEQSNQLFKLGVRECYASILEQPKHIGHTEDVSKVFNVTDLLNILPREIIIDNRNHILSIELRDSYCSVYYFNIFNGSDEISFQREEQLVDALYKMTIWCLENKHIKNPYVYDKY